MNGLATSEAVAKTHAPLVQRAAAIMGSAASAPLAVLRGKGEPVPDGPCPCVTIERAAANRLSREARREHFALSYRDPAAAAPLAALVAALTPSGDPIAADPETLSILALADRLASSDIPVLINGPIHADRAGDRARKSAALARALSAITALAMGLDRDQPISAAVVTMLEAARKTVLGSVLQFDAVALNDLRTDVQDIANAFKSAAAEVQ